MRCILVYIVHVLFEQCNKLVRVACSVLVIIFWRIDNMDGICLDMVMIPIEKEEIQEIKV